ncbi:cell wall-associated NlpC family hydrolase [Lentzea atacamensis]|uniref:Cell wall-associated NlpC family hydrolase n=2 Tax=Lentzea TaxID=165301 RepID=A0A316HWG2_9PSEU|nr:NlpC/P60 family protein [Lentzea atacamensis]PWK82607.1 cell wall-associated NlpC family hydrolase [Lentzea atacamensis]RAS63116.1 cell wall-associated NlpC family hydrolase [Lentzea atacamensis]
MSRKLTRGVLVTALLFSALPAVSFAAQPADPARVYADLTAQATKLNEEVLRAQEDLVLRRAELERATADVAAAQQIERQAKSDENAFRDQVDLITQASFEGARFNQLSALLVADSQQDFLNRLEMMRVLAADKAESLALLSGAVEKARLAHQVAENARTRAAEAMSAAERLKSDLDARSRALQAQTGEVRAALARLPAPVVNQLRDPGDRSPVSVPQGAAGLALAFALEQRGDEYRYGATGLHEWDCAGLTMKAYAAAGYAIPRTSGGQAGVGRVVTRADVRAGDLIIYYSSRSHVAMAVDNTRAVHASTEGQPVKIAPIDAIGPIAVIRRIEG